MRFDVHRTARKVGGAALVVPLLAARASKMNRHVRICDGGLLQVHADRMLALVIVPFDFGFNARSVQAIPRNSFFSVNLGPILRRVD
jgi:hypothetical protein